MSISRPHCYKNWWLRMQHLYTELPCHDKCRHLSWPQLSWQNKGRQLSWLWLQCQDNSIQIKWPQLSWQATPLVSVAMAQSSGLMQETPLASPHQDSVSVAATCISRSLLTLGQDAEAESSDNDLLTYWLWVKGEASLTLIVYWTCLHIDSWCTGSKKYLL